MRFALLLPAALLVAAGAPAAQEKPATPLSALEFLVGSCWSGTGPRGETDRHCFSKAMGHFVRDVHDTSGLPRPYGGETLYHWDPAAAVVRFTYWNTDGGVSTGTMTVQNGALHFPEVHEGKDGKRMEIRNVWTRQGADAYVAKAEVRKGDTWSEMFRIVYTRVPAAPKQD
jgi:hypothetical protein